MLGTGQGQSPVRKSGRGGLSGENSFSGKTGIHFKISAQKGQQGCSQARRGPPSPYGSPHETCSPHKGPWPGPAGKRHRIYNEARAGGGGTSITEYRLGCGGREGVQPRPICSWPAQCPYPAQPPGTPFTSQYRGEGWRRKPGLMRVYSTSEKLLRWEKENQVEKGLPITRNKGDWWAGGGEGPARRGF